MAYIRRLIPIQETLKTKSVLLLGPRRTGKSAYLKHQLEADRSYDLLKSDVFRELSFRPSLIRERLGERDRVVVIDEIQKLPQLMDEVHSLIEDRGIRFVLTGSSARKLRRTHTSLMAGRARRLELHPFCFGEVSGQFELERVLQYGALPHVFLNPDGAEAWAELMDYSGDYLREEILAEALVRKIDAFSRFLPTAALSNGELLNFEAIAGDAQVPARTIREYYAVLEDTLIGRSLQPKRFKGVKSRKAIATNKFYFFDCGVLNALTERKHLPVDSPEFGNLFETWVFNELQAYGHYRRPRDEMHLAFWRSPTGDEVDFLVNDEIAIEVKASRSVSEKHVKGLSALGALMGLKKQLIVCREKEPRRMGQVEILPWRIFAERLWSGELLGK